MIDLFETEQKILDAATKRANELRNGAVCDNEEYITLAKEYGGLLKQLRKVTKISDRTAGGLNSSNNELLEKTHYDALTGIYNRRFLEESLKRIVRSLSRSGDPLSVLMLDVDCFKEYNEIYGRRRGDECLKIIAMALFESLFRADDLVARYDSDKFVIVLPNTDESGARVIADRIIENIVASNIPHEKNAAASCVTVSIGVVTDTERRKQDGDDYLKRASEALHTSKQAGRNRHTIVSFSE